MPQGMAFEMLLGSLFALDKVCAKAVRASGTSAKRREGGVNKVEHQNLPIERAVLITMWRTPLEL